MKYFRLSAEDAIASAETSFMIRLEVNERINEPKWFKALIFEGIVKLMKKSDLAQSQPKLEKVPSDEKAGEEPSEFKAEKKQSEEKTDKTDPKVEKEPSKKDQVKETPRAVFYIEETGHFSVEETSQGLTFFIPFLGDHEGHEIL